jgi:hypothetical protein
MLRIGRPLPNISVRDRVSIGIFERRPPLLPGWRREVTPPTQVVRPPFFVNENKFFAPLVQVTPSTERQLADDLTANEAKAMLIADANVLEHGSAKPRSPYAKAQIAWRRRAATAIPTKSKVESEEKKRHQRELAFDLLGRVPTEGDQHQRSKRLRAEKKAIVQTIAAAFGCSERETTKRFGVWFKEFLRSRDAAEG